MPDFGDWLGENYGIGPDDLSDDDWEYYHNLYEAYIEEEF